jgi:hypothetical protein
LEINTFFVLDRIGNQYLQIAVSCHIILLFLDGKLEYIETIGRVCTRSTNKGTLKHGNKAETKGEKKPVRFNHEIDQEAKTSMKANNNFYFVIYSFSRAPYDFTNILLYAT